VTILESGRIMQTGTGLDIVVNPRTAIKCAAVAPTAS
jgi:ABC-type proline/glycine betaine transport system ATPase subunit